MIQVKLIAHTNVNPMELASHAALMCYQAEAPEMGKIIDVENRLFKVGHHTTLQHFYITYEVQGIAVGDITFGMHLASPFYNSCQRSGRYSAKMFIEPNFGKIKNYVKIFWPDITADKLRRVMNYVRHSVSLYHEYISQAKEIAAKSLKEERPHISEKNLEQNAPKIAQEQMRMFIPIIFPTAFDFTINLTALVAMWKSAWTPPMKYVTENMKQMFLEKFPDTEFIFSGKRNTSDWAMNVPEWSSVKIRYKPGLKLIDIIGESEDYYLPSHDMMHPVDLLHFLPETMGNSVSGIRTQIEISTATMGQDQRHRTIGRGKPKFIGAFYSPPIVRKLKLEKEIKKLMRQWLMISRLIPKSLAMVLAPYGAMVTYKKQGSLNAVAHEQAKRLCWCAQEEIYHLGRSLRFAIEKKRGRQSKLLRIFEPPCYRTGKCAEGARYCGRDLKIRKSGDYFPERKV